MGQQNHDLKYEEFLKAMRECERSKQDPSYRNLISICGGSNSTIKKYLGRFITELAAPSSDLPLSMEVTRSISREIQRQVAFINQEQQERLELINQLIGDATTVNDEVNERILNAEQSLSALRANFTDLQSRHAELQESSSRQLISAYDSIAASQADVAALRQDVDRLNNDNGRLTALLENEGLLKTQHIDKLSVAEAILNETQQALQAREVIEARLAAELRAADDKTAMHQTLLSEADKNLCETRRQLLESEKRCAALEALREVPRDVRQKGKSKPPQLPASSS